MNPRAAVITGYTNDPTLGKIMLQSLNNQVFRDFDCYVYASPTTSHYIEDSFLEGLSYKCYQFKLEKNLGFTGNNNFCIRKAFDTTDYTHIVVVNDDTIPDADWLKEMIKMAQSSTEIGAVASKMVFYQKFMTLTGETQTAMAPNDSRVLGVRYYENTRFTTSFYPKRFYTEGFYHQETDEIGPYKWTSGKFIIEVPVLPAPDGVYTLKISLKKNDYIPDQKLELKIGDSAIATIALTDAIYYEVNVPADIMKKNMHHIIQNAGSGLTPNFSGYDIGFGEIDKGQYETPREVQMFCGGSFLITREALLKTGLFLDGYFVYYEDSDLSLQVKKQGFKIVYCPTSIIEHYHTATNKEWSPFFIYHVFRNKIIFSARNFGFKAFMSSLSERGKETYTFFKLYTKSRFKNQDYKHRLKLNLVILKDAIGGVIKFKPKYLKK